jgi:protein transport protein SEC31
MICCRFNRLAWGALDSTRPKGVVAGGLESGELSLWDADKLLNNAE